MNEQNSVEELAKNIAVLSPEHKQELVDILESLGLGDKLCVLKFARALKAKGARHD